VYDAPKGYDHLVFSLFSTAVSRITKCLEEKVCDAVYSPALAGDHSNLSATTVIKTELDSSHRCLEVTWNDGERTSYPYIWLRDNCQCSTCFHSTTLARRLLFHNIDFNVMPINVEVSVFFTARCAVYCRNLVIPRLHDTTGCQTGLTTGCIHDTTGCHTG